MILNKTFALKLRAIFQFSAAEGFMYREDGI